MFLAANTHQEIAHAEQAVVDVTMDRTTCTRVTEKGYNTLHQLDPLVSEELYISIYIYTTETEVPESIGQAITINKHVFLVW